MALNEKYEGLTIEELHEAISSGNLTAVELVIVRSILKRKESNPSFQEEKKNKEQSPIINSEEVLEEKVDEITPSKKIIKKSEERKDLMLKVRNLFDEGKHTSEIAKALDCKYSDVYWIVKCYKKSK